MRVCACVSVSVSVCVCVCVRLCVRARMHVHVRVRYYHLLEVATCKQQTNFQQIIACPGLKPCMSISLACHICRFAHFFASPLLDKSSLNREIEAVDSGEEGG